MSNDYEEETYEDELPCPECGGSGIFIEGWDCVYCEGTGNLDN